MTNKYTKFVGIALAAVLLPVVASAATIEELQAQINALMAQLSAAKPAATASCSAVFSKTLKAGMSDQEVWNLQKFLNSDPATQVAAMGVGSMGNETMFFGPATKAAVIKFQNKYSGEVLAPAGLSAGTGLVGAMTRAKLNALCSSTQTTTTTTTTTTGGNVGTVSGLSGLAGSISATDYTSDTETNLVTGKMDNILGFKIQADGSDVNITHLKIKFTNTQVSTTASNLLTRYFESFDVMQDGVKVGSVSAADFTRDSAGVYSKTFALSKAVVRMGSGNKSLFYIRALPISTIDTDSAGSTKGTWKAEMLEARYQDATGVILSSTLTTNESGINVAKLSTSADVKVKVSAGSANPDDRVVFVSDTNSGDKVTMLEFKIKAEGTDLSFDQLKATATPMLANATNGTTSNMVTEFQLVDSNGVVLKSVDSSGSPFTSAGAKLVTFDLDTPYKISQDNTATFKIVVRVQKISTATFAQGDNLKVDYQSNNAQDKNGDNITTFSGSATGKVQTFRATGLNIAKVSSSNTVNVNNTTPSLSYGEFKMDVKVTASGDDIWVPLTIASSTALSAGVNYSMLDASTGLVASSTTQSASISLVSGGTRDGNYIKVADGESATFEAVVSFDPAAAGQYKLQINDVGYTLTGATGVATAQIAATPVQDFQTSVSTIQ